MPCSQVGGFVLALDHSGRLAERNHRQDAEPFAGFVDRPHVVALVERCGLSGDPFLDAAEQIVGQARFVGTRCLDAPRNGKLRAGANGRAQLVAVEAAALPGADCGAVPPRCIGIGKALALGAVMSC